MGFLTDPLARLLRRLTGGQETALRDMSKGASLDQRLVGFSTSERIDAKFLLLAICPFVPIVISDEAGWSRGALWYGWFWVSVVWAVTILGFNLAVYLRALFRSIRRKM